MVTWVKVFWSQGKFSLIRRSSEFLVSDLVEHGSSLWVQDSAARCLDSSHCSSSGCPVCRFPQADVCSGGMLVRVLRRPCRRRCSHCSGAAVAVMLCTRKVAEVRDNTWLFPQM